MIEQQVQQIREEADEVDAGLEPELPSQDQSQDQHDAAGLEVEVEPEAPPQGEDSKR